jgi:hypothetical protein
MPAPPRTAGPSEAWTLPIRRSLSRERNARSSTPRHRAAEGSTTARIRKHPLGGRIGKLLGSVYQWRDFFGPAALDPIRDVDQIVVVGPQFRDSSGVVAVLKLNVPDERVRLAIDALVKSDPEGQWLDAGAPSAIAHADRAPREFVLPAPGIVVVTPPGGLAEQAAKSELIGCR